MTSWHVPAEDLDRYAHGAASGIGLASIESHLVGCEHCRQSLTSMARSTRDDDAVWAGIVARVDKGPRMFARSSRLWHVSLSSPPLAMVTVLLASLMVACVLIAAVASAPDATAILVVAGPLVPLITARLAFVDRIDPSGRMAAAAPIGGSRVAAMRALVAVLLACAAGVLVTPVTTLSLSDSGAWLLPALAGCAVAVAIGTFVDSTLPTGVFALGWVVATGVWLHGAPSGMRGATVDGLVSADPVVQVGLLVATALAAGVAIANRDGRRVRWTA